jgi:hypothetical protein
MGSKALQAEREIRPGFRRQSIANADAHAMQSTLRTCLVPISPDDTHLSAFIAAWE